MNVRHADDAAAWDSWLKKQRFTPFLQSWTMGEVYRDIGQQPVRLIAEENGTVQGICQAIEVPARRGKHLMVQYGPLCNSSDARTMLLDALCDTARDRGCGFVRVSPFLPQKEGLPESLHPKAIAAPLHLLSEHMWYIPLREYDRWTETSEQGKPRNEQSILEAMRQTTRNLTRRAERKGVVVEASADPLRDLELYFALQKETYRRHGFVPYPESFIRAQVRRFSAAGEATVYVARYQGEALAASVHMHTGGETSYHHGASTHAHPKIPASTLLQWTAIRDALQRGDDIYSFWGIAPRIQGADGKLHPDMSHPFAGVTTFKTGFGGKQLDLLHCFDIPLHASYSFTRLFEFARKWKRGF